MYKTRIIEDYFKRHRIRRYSFAFSILFYHLKDRDLSKIIDKIEANPNNAGVVQILVNKILKKYDVTVPDVPIKKPKAPAFTNYERQIKFRSKHKKSSLQILVSSSLKEKLLNLKEKENITYEKLLENMVYEYLKKKNDKKSVEN